MAAQAGLCLAWSETPEDTFCHDEAHMYLCCLTLDYEFQRNIMYFCMLLCPKNSSFNSFLYVCCICKSSVIFFHLTLTDDVE